MSTTLPNRVIQEQVKLPVAIALEVVLQGIRIRLGRSIVTILGVALGIAFLMSILTSQLIRQGVSNEQKTRAEIQRMISFLTADSGPLRDRTIGVIQTGPLSPLETRFLDGIRDSRPASVLWAPASLGVAAPPSVQAVALAAVARDASAVVVMGDGSLPVMDWPSILEPSRQKVVAFARKIPPGKAPSTESQPAPVYAIAGATVVDLSRELKQDEIDARNAALKTERYRSVWIIVVSLLVTVIGISNSMLMSVTERFREIGTMKCLGALSSFIRRLFLIESTLVGTIGALLGVLFGIIFPLVLYGWSFSLGMVIGSLNWGQLGLYGLFSLVVGIVLSMVAAVYPARFASRMVPAAALRSNI